MAEKTPSPWLTPLLALPGAITVASLTAALTQRTMIVTVPVVIVTIVAWILYGVFWKRSTALTDCPKCGREVPTDFLEEVSLDEGGGSILTACEHCLHGKDYPSTSLWSRFR